MKGVILLDNDDHDERRIAAAMALSMYAGEPCRICGELITTDGVKTAVFAGYSESGARAAHKPCWDKYPSDEAGTPRPEWVHQ